MTRKMHPATGLSTHLVGEEKHLGNWGDGG